MKRLLMVMLLTWMNSVMAEFTIPQDVMDSLSQDGSARLMVRLDVPFTPEGNLTAAEIVEQRSQIADAQDVFETTLKTNINGSGIDDPSGVGTAISLIGEAIKFETVPYVAMQVNGMSLSAMLQDDSVARISLDRLDDGSLLKSLELIGVDVVQASGNTGAGQTIAIVGSGVSNVLSKYEACFSTDDGSLVSTVCPNGTIEQIGTGAGAACDAFNCDHETKVAKIVTAIAPDVSLIPVQVYSEFALDCSGTMPCGRTYISDQVRALEYLLSLQQAGVDISAVNLSLNGGVKFTGSCDDDSRKESVDNLLSVGVVTIASAGNQGFADGVQAPACISSVVAVGATSADGGIAEFSNRGGELDLLAPGVMIVDGELLEGTSFAAPMVAGSIALVSAAKPDAGVTEVMGLLRDSGQDVDGMARIQVDEILSPSSLFASEKVLIIVDGDLYTWNVGSDITQLILDYSEKIKFAKFSPSGNKIAFQTRTGTSSWSGYKLHVFDGSKVITDVATRLSIGFDFIDENTILISHDTNPSDYQRTYVSTVSLDTKIISKMESNNKNEIYISTSITPTGTYYALSRDTNGNSCAHCVDIFYGLVNSSISILKTISNSGADYTPNLSTNANLIAYVNNGSVYIYNVSSGDNNILGKGNNPVWVNDDMLLYSINGTIWQHKISTNEKLSTNISGIVQDSTNFIPETTTYLSTVKSVGNGTITTTDNSMNCGEICQADYEINSTITLTATPKTGYSFKEWTGDCSDTSATTTVTMNSVKNCSAIFEEEPVATNGCDIVSDGLVACYSFDGNANDYSGNGNNGNEYGGFSYITGAIGQAAQFDGIDDYVGIANSPELELNRYVTISYFIAPQKSSSAIPVVIKNSHTGNNYSSWIYGDLDRISFQQYPQETTSKHSFFADFATVEEEFTHVVTVRNDSLVKLYANGKLLMEYVANYDAKMKKENLFIGYDGGYGYKKFKGLIDDVRIYNRAITEQEIQILYNLGQPVQSGLTVIKSGERGRILAKINGEDWTLNCGLNCQQANYDYPPNSQLTITAYPDKGFTFKGWTGDCTNTTGRIKLTLDTPKTCTAQFEPDTTANLLTINNTSNSTITSTDGYLNCGEICTSYYPTDKIVRLQVTPATDEIFMGWGGDCNGTNLKATITMDTAKTCTTTFKPLIAGDLTFTVQNNGEVGTVKVTKIGDTKASLICIGKQGCTQDQHDYQAGSKVKVIATPNANFKFETGSGDYNWAIDDNGRASAIIIMDSAKTCTANFTLQDNPSNPIHLLTINTIGTGTVNNPALIDCGTNCTADHYPEGTTVRLKAIPSDSAKFANWTGDCESTSTGIKVIITKGMTCTANFKSGMEVIADNMTEAFNKISNIFDNMVDAFYAQAKLADGRLVAEVYPRAINEERVKEALWLAITAIMQTDQHLTISNAQFWPSQFDDIEWLPNDTSTNYTNSIKIMADQFVGIKVDLLTADNIEQNTGIAIYYSDNPPDDGSGWGVSSYFSRYAFRL